MTIKKDIFLLFGLSCSSGRDTSSTQKYGLRQRNSASRIKEREGVERNYSSDITHQIKSDHSFTIRTVTEHYADN